jgi:hypothetical protein
MAVGSGATDPTRNTAKFLDPMGIGDHLNATWGYRKLQLLSYYSKEEGKVDSVTL